MIQRNQRLIEKIAEQKTYTVSDTYLVNRVIEEYQKIVNSKNQLLEYNKLYYKQQIIS